MSDSSSSSAHRLPDYLRNTYSWAYLDHRTVPWLDRPVVVSAILWGNASRLMDAAVREFAPGQRVLLDREVADLIATLRRIPPLNSHTGR